MKTIHKTDAIDKVQIDNISKQFFDIFNNTNQKQPDWTVIEKTCIPETIIIKKNGRAQVAYDLFNFIEPRNLILTNGTLTNFQEEELMEETKIILNIAQRYSKYQKTGLLNGVNFIETGTKLFQFIKIFEGWKINSLVWEDDKI